MITTIKIRNLALRCIIGVFPEEREKLQDVLINIDLDCRIPDAARSDAIGDTVDYKAVNKKVIAFVEGSSFQLLETLADRLAALCLEDDERIESVTVSVDKPGALRFARSAAVEVRRGR